MRVSHTVDWIENVYCMMHKSFGLFLLGYQLCWKCFQFDISKCSIEINLDSFLLYRHEICKFLSFNFEPTKRMHDWWLSWKISSIKGHTTERASKWKNLWLKVGHWCLLHTFTFLSYILCLLVACACFFLTYFVFSLFIRCRVSFILPRRLGKYFSELQYSTRRLHAVYS